MVGLFTGSTELYSSVFLDMPIGRTDLDLHADLIPFIIQDDLENAHAWENDDAEDAGAHGNEGEEVADAIEEDPAAGEVGLLHVEFHLRHVHSRS